MKEPPKKIIKVLDEAAKEILAACSQCKIRECPQTLEEIVLCNKHEKSEDKKDV